MQDGWLFYIALAFACFWGSSRLVSTARPPGYLVAVALALLGLASALGGVMLGLQWQTRLENMHFYAAHAFGVAGLYLLTMAMIDWIGWLRLHRGLWLAHLGDAAIVYALGLWLGLLPLFQQVMTVVANLVCLFIAVALVRRGRTSHAKWLALAAVVFVVAVWAVGGGEWRYSDQPVRAALMYGLLAVWVYCMTQVVRFPAEVDQ